MPTNYQLKHMQSLPLEAKVIKSQVRIREWYEYYNGMVYVSFSGGKDSTVMLDIVRGLYPDVPAVFFDTGLEYPEIKEFVKSIDNVVYVRPKMSFRDVIKHYGYPVVSKEQAQYIRQFNNTKSLKLAIRRLVGNEAGFGRISNKWLPLIAAPFKVDDRCCDALKKRPAELYERESGRMPFIGTMASDSRRRWSEWLRYGCNAFEKRRPMSTPLGFWLEEDIWAYIKSRQLKYASIYDKGEERTGCIFCMFGLHMEGEPNRFQRLKKLHPKLYDYCINDLGCGQVLDYIGAPY